MSNGLEWIAPFAPESWSLARFVKKCVAIAQELGEDYADAWISCDQALRDAWLATCNLIGRTEEDPRASRGTGLSRRVAKASKD